MVRFRKFALDEGPTVKCTVEQFQMKTNQVVIHADPSCIQFSTLTQSINNLHAEFGVVEKKRAQSELFIVCVWYGRNHRPFKNKI